MSKRHRQKKRRVAEAASASTTDSDDGESPLGFVVDERVVGSLGGDGDGMPGVASASSTSAHVKRELRNQSIAAVVLDRSSAARVTKDACGDDFVRSLTEFWLKEVGCDLVLHAEGRAMPCHKLVLAVDCQWLRQLIEADGGVPEVDAGRTPHVTLDVPANGCFHLSFHGVPSKSIYAVLSFSYGGSLLLAEDNALDILLLAVILGNQTLVTVCTNFLHRAVCTTNAVRVLVACDSLGVGPDETKTLRPLYERCVGMVTDNLRHPHIQQTVASLPLECLGDILGAHELNIVSEMEVFECIARWIKADEAARAPHFHQLLGCCRLHFAVEDDLTAVLEHSYTQASAEATAHLAEILAWRASGQDVPRGVKPRQRLEFVHSIFIFGGNRNQEFTHPFKSSLQFLTAQGKYASGRDMASVRDGAGAVVFNGDLYAIGGALGARKGCTKTCERYDVKLQRWVDYVPGRQAKKPRKSLATLNVERSSFACVSAQGFIYVIGGLDSEGKIIKSVEQFDLEDNEWRPLTPLRTGRFGCTGVCLDGSVHVFGGFSGSMSLSSAEKYSVKRGKWIKVPAMHEARFCACAAIWQGKIYLIGGCNDFTTLATVEVYDPSTESWIYLSPMAESRAAAGCIAHDGRIYVFGGYTTQEDEGDVTLASCECYDVLRNTWERLPDLPEPRSSPAVADLLLRQHVTGSAWKTTVKREPSSSASAAPAGSVQTVHSDSDSSDVILL